MLLLYCCFIFLVKICCAALITDLRSTRLHWGIEAAAESPSVIRRCIFYSTVVARLKEELVCPYVKIESRVKLNHIRLEDFPSVSEYGSEIQRLFELAYSLTMDRETREELMKDKFLSGLSPQLRRAIKPLTLNSYKDMLSKL